MRTKRIRPTLGVLTGCALSSAVFCGALLVQAAGESGPAGGLKSGVDRSTFDTAVKPGDNFFLYVNGTWIKNNPIPPEYSRWGAFPKLRDDNLDYLREILEELTKSSGAQDDDRRKLRDLYLAAMDEAKLEKQGATPLAGDLERIARINSPDELISEVGRLRTEGTGALFTFYVSQDEKQSERYAVHLRQGGLGLPEREYYLGSTDDSKKIRGQYREHVAKMLALLGDSPEAAAKGADAVLAIETQLAEASRTPVAAARSRGQLQQEDARRAGHTFAQRELAAVLQNHRGRRRVGDHRRTAGIHHPGQRDATVGFDGGLADLSALAPGARQGALPEQPVREREFSLLQRSHAGRETDAAALEAGHRRR